jgi:hypothetical protein
MVDYIAFFLFLISIQAEAVVIVQSSLESTRIVYPSSVDTLLSSTFNSQFDDLAGPEIDWI